MEWLEYYLNQQHITLLLVTRSRYFPGRNVSEEEIWELDNGTMYVL